MTTVRAIEAQRPEDGDGTVSEAAILNAMPHVVVILGPDGDIRDANSSAENFFDGGVAILRRSRLEDLVAFGSPLLALVAQVRRTQVSVNEYNIDLGMPRSQDERLVDVYCTPFGDTPGSLLLIMQQRNMAKMIERHMTHRAAARSVSGLASVLAHEIKNPLSGIRGAAQLLEMTQDDEGRAWTQLICTETDRIRDLVDRMEVFGDERPIPRDAVNIHSVLDHVARLGRTGFAAGVAIEEHYDPSLPLVSGDHDQLIQVFLNLVKNAAEAIGSTTGDGRIVLSTAFRSGVHLKAPGSQSRVSLPMMISIEDNGPGIAPDMRRHLFDPFVTSRISGSGLGLALVAKIVHDHDGVIEFDSEPGKTVFRVLLPLHAEPEQHGADEDRGLA